VFLIDNSDTTILIADDEPTNRLIAKLALSKEGYNVVEATNGKEALHLAKKYSPDVILMDAVMPIMDGFEAISKIKSDDELNNIPILMVTALDTQEDKIRAFNSGANDYLSKPFDVKELILRVRSFAQMRKLYIQNVKARIDPNYKLPNIQALREKVEKSLYPNGLFFQIRDFENITYLYGIEGSKIIVKDLLKKITKFCEISRNEIFVLNEDRFVIYWESEELIPKDKLLLFAKRVHKFVNRKSFGDKLFQSDIKINIVANQLKENFVQIGILSLKEVVKKNMSYILADNIYKDMTKNIENTMQMIEYIDKAIEQNRVVPVYQAIMDTKTKEIYKYECLVRIEREDGSLMSPFFFLDIAKQSDQYPDITKIMIEKTFSYMKDKNCEFSINLSSIDMENSELLHFLFNKLAQYKLAKRLIIELLEDEAIHNFELVLKFIKDVKKLGVRIAIDDYGSGYSNLERIFQFKPDYIKIDGSIIKGICKDDTKLAIAKSAVFLSRELGIKTIGEFISDKDILQKAKEIDIDYLQGYYICEPSKEVNCNYCFNDNC
jgi:EAL domain-containing protein (putative c-di-GMP-specific phosphodiesterase class I)/DNA-binding response OmpR family regulator